MSDSLGFAVALASYVAVAAIGVYAAYWAFAIRGKLMGRIYRNHALWLGVLGLLVAVPTKQVIPLTSSNPFINSLAAFYGYFPWPLLIVFAFIDSTIPLMRRSDPLLRGIFHWQKLRLGLWILLAFRTVLGIYVSIYFPTCWLAASNLACTSYAVSNPAWLEAASGMAGSYIAWVTLLPLILGAGAFLIGARRSRDMMLRESVKWLGVGFLLLCLGVVLVIGIERMLNLSIYYTTYSYGAVPWETVILLFGYALYRSARSLAPLNRLPHIEPEMSALAREATS